AGTSWCTRRSTAHLTTRRKPISTAARPPRTDALKSASASRTRAMTYAAQNRLAAELDSIREQGLYKTERVITTPQSSHISTTDGKQVLNFCANNYLGLADNAEIIKAAKDALDTHGFGLASVRFICGT